ncbi:MAG: mycofactocin biosynthesis peptidyl-dipeptidase MftE [Acidimicrobiia bacterium]|nr:mycofactocin biosynthesis peptidyl-dipeptidase MftE [Acidimicrobiia bacterium]MYJ61856.1 mycofactocin biosynthesis peptidyl-dipeptidase MftE [Acidimicrobiia bacterium]
MSWTALGERLDKSPLDVIIPLGAFEQHGPHLPLDTDTLIAEAVADRAAQRAGECVVSPCIPVGASSHHLAFKGTASLSDNVLKSVTVEVINTLLSHGFRGAYLVTGHAGNVGAMALVMAELDPTDRSRVVSFDDWPAQRDAVHQVAETKLDLHRELVGTHGGHFETSILLAIAPHRVDMASAVAGHVGPASSASAKLRSEGMAALSPVGIIGDPRGASADAGELYLDALVSLVVEGIEAHRSRMNQRVAP